MGVLKNIERNKYYHLCCNGICQHYMTWTWKGEVTKTPVVLHKDEVDVTLNDRLEDMVSDIGEDYFKITYVYDTLCSDMEVLYSGCTNFIGLSAVLRLFNLKAKNG